MSGAESSLVGRVLAQTYRVERLLGKGGMGAVYEAAHLRLPTKVAVKVLHAEAAANEEIFTRFRKEAEITSALRHPNIVQVLDFNHLPDGTPYLVMEYLDGEDLHARLRQRGRLSYQEAVTLMRAIGAGLTAAHKKGVVHRDLKPSNVMLVRDSAVPRGERVKVLDFGIAKLLQGQAKETAPNAVMGTPQYMSPEQCRGAGGVDEKTDVYALGLMLFEMVAGRPPFIAEMPLEYIGQHAFREPPALQSFAPTVSDQLASFVHSLLV